LRKKGEYFSGNAVENFIREGAFQADSIEGGGREEVGRPLYKIRDRRLRGAGINVLMIGVRSLSVIEPITSDIRLRIEIPRQRAAKATIRRRKSSRMDGRDLTDKAMKCGHPSSKFPPPGRTIANRSGHNS
jgi:hypothetical protein